MNHSNLDNYLINDLGISGSSNHNQEHAWDPVAAALKPKNESNLVNIFILLLYYYPPTL